MRNNKTAILSGLLALVAGFTSCVEEHGFHPLADGVQLIFRADAEREAGSKASMDDSYAFVWESGDRLGLFIDNSSTPTVNELGEAYVHNSVATYSATVNNYSAGDRLYAYFPYASGAERDGNKVRLAVEPKQTQVSVGVLNGKNFPMVSVPYTFKSDSPAREEPYLHFKHLAAFLEFDVFAAEDDYVGEIVQSVELQAESTVAGAFQFADAGYCLVAGL